MRTVFEKVRRASDASFACNHFDGAVFDCPYHVHPEFELIHIEAGHGSRVVGDQVGSFHPDELLLLGPGLPHMYVTDGSLSSGGSRSRFIQFLPGCLGDSFFALPEMRSVRQMLDASARGLAFGPVMRTRALPLLDTLWRSSGGLRVARWLELLTLLAGDRRARPLATCGYRPPAPAQRDTDRMVRVTTLINERLLGTLTLADAADAACLSPEAFSRFFSRQMGQPFIDYVIGLRIGRACRQLIETDRTTLAICHDCGFRNLSNFNRQFRRMKGMTPRDFRASLPTS